MRWKWSAAAVAASLVATSVSFGAERTTFVDVSAESWCSPYVDACVENGLMEGVGDGRFAPEKVLSVEEALVLAARITWKVDGGTPRELIELIYPGEDPDVFQIEMEKFRSMKDRWSWDGVFYLTKRFREVYGPGSTYWYRLDAAATREEFFTLLSLPVKLADPDTLNQVAELPDGPRRGEDVDGLYRLYETGIVTGVDEYGFAALGASLTRAEAAAMAARVLTPELRVTGYDPAPLPTDGYTLTYLADGTAWLNYPLVFVEPTDVESYFLTLDGKKVDWPEGTEQGVPSFGLDTRGDYVYLRPWTGPTGTTTAPRWGSWTARGRWPSPLNGAWTCGPRETGILSEPWRR